MKLGVLCNGGCGRTLDEDNTKERGAFRLPNLCDTCNYKALIDHRAKNRPKDKKS